MLGIGITMLLLGGRIAYSGGPRSPMLSWIVLPVGMVAARFPPQVLVAGLAMFAPSGTPLPSPRHPRPVGSRS